VLLSDGEMGEGSNWEAMMFAAHHGLDNLVGIIDYNKLQSLTTVDQTLRIEPLADKFTAFGWAVRRSTAMTTRAGAARWAHALEGRQAMRC
jgi:transketolase